MKKNSKIYIAGHEGMVGSALLNELTQLGYNKIIYSPLEELDLRLQEQTFNFISLNKPEYIFLIAGKVGGINANIQYPAEYLYDNIMIASNIIEAARKFMVKKVLFLGSSCIYPRECRQPMKEEYILDGKLEPTNEGYAIGKIAGIKLCEYYNKQYGCNFISAIPPNLYGPKDNFSFNSSHVISAMIRKMHNAKISNQETIELWGTGCAKREFLYVEDLVRGLIFLMNYYNDITPINIGCNKDICIKKLADIIKNVVKYSGDLYWNTSKPDGMPRKLMDSTKINNLGWNAQKDLEEGLIDTYKWYLEFIG